MMLIKIQYEAQAKWVAGVSSETIEVSDRCRVSDCIRQVAESHGDDLKQVLLDGAGDIQSTLLLFLDDQQIVRDDEFELADGNTLTIMTPISGG